MRDLIIPFIVAAGVALFAQQYFRAAETVGAVKERARVETAEKKIDAKIVKAQRAAAKQPSDSVLDRWSRP